MAEHKCLTIADYQDANGADHAGTKIPAMTPTKRKKDLESPNGAFTNLTDAVGVLKAEIEAVLNHVETVGGGTSDISISAKESQDQGASNWMELAI